MKNSLITELEKVFIEKGNINVKAYYTQKANYKYFYDYAFNGCDNFLSGKYNNLNVLELIYYLQEQK